MSRSEDICAASDSKSFRMAVLPGLYVYLMGTRPKRCAMTSSLMQDVFSSKVTRSMAYE